MNPTVNVSFDDTATAFAAKSDAELAKMYMLFAAMNNNKLVKYGTALTQKAFSWHLPVKFMIKPTIFNHFCGGETIEECQQAIDTLGRYNVGTILDYSVEGEGKEQSFDATASEIIATIERAAASDYIPFSVFKVTGLGNPALLEKVQNRQELNADERAAFERLRARVNQICERAEERNVRIFIDAEESWFQDTIDNLAYEMMEKYNRKKAIVYNTYQLYRHDRLDVLKQDYQDAVRGNYFLGAKLVRGAYMEKERRVADQKGYPSPINPDKPASDNLFDEALRYCVKHIDWISFCAGTHNEKSTFLLMELMEEAGIAPGDERIYFAQLYGMSDNISFNLAKAGYNVAKYVPYGPVESVMPYLFRRAQENTAIAGQSSREFNLIKKEMDRRKKIKK
ncbi:MAG: proline dehydrogenase family protein [Hymenobacteraceae bacterium]|nr:proline dehydrogenase family protein [Hymenobacteraceae bacterium]MDX5396145.1 proline dehydrogenase family protein [Hymenobacteraceae bacterium]MDX5442292.1 proline dehydrogenase family protein [Hymenobacteraceae bacterium]MDX5512206.1 proline dehydrogenase family protein [Hymenobacteraceae bacterium]